MNYREYKVRLPMRVKIKSASKKTTALNLNIYRNLHFRSLSALKNTYQEIVKKLIKDIPPLGRIKLHYQLHTKSKRKIDIMNFGSIVDKFFCDALTKHGVIVDDNYEFIDFVSFGFGGVVDIEHIIVTITEIEPRKEDQMQTQIMLDLSDFSDEASKYLQSINATGLTISNVDGSPIAELILDEHSPAVETPKPKQKRRTKAQMEADNKAEEKANVEVPDGDSDAVDSSGDVESTKDETSKVKADSSVKEGNKQKNLFEESPETSSKVESGDSNKKEEESGDKPVKAAKKSSIFDQ